MNSLADLRKHNQSVWLDYIRRDFVLDGELKTLIEKNSVHGVTSNPAIFEKAIGGGQYDDFLQRTFEKNPSVEPRVVYDEITIEDVRNAADVLRPVFNECNSVDGFVSIEPPPQVTLDTDMTLREARRIHQAIGRPNVMIKVAATKQGVAAVEELIAEGMSINITLMFSLSHYENVARAYIRGLERCQTPEKVSSVASFFVSRVDTQVDKALEVIGTPDALALRGKIAVANAKRVYRRFLEIFHGEAFDALRRRGAHVQRPLWASTGTKNKAYSDVLYVEELIGPHTVNTMPPETLAAFREHGHVRGDTLTENVSEAENQLRVLAGLGVNLDAITEKLQVDGVAAFAAAYDRVMDAIARERSVHAHSVHTIDMAGVTRS